MIKKVFITGSNGQLGRELKKQLDALGIDSAGYDLPDFDVADSAQVQAAVEKEQPDIIINCAAMTNVDGCELNQDAAQRANAEGARVMAQAAKALDIPIVQVSTDYVFDGEGIVEDGARRPYVETDPTAPQSVYGSTKLDGEKAVEAETDKHYIVRTAWLYGDGNNFVKTMLRLSKTHPEITVVNDQFGSPTSTVDLARAIIALMDTGKYGIYHATNEGACSWCDFAGEIFRLADTGTTAKPVSSEEYAANAGKPVAHRPPYSVLENKALKDNGIDVFRPWQEALVEYLDTLDLEAL